MLATVAKGGTASYGTHYVLRTQSYVGAKRVEEDCGQNEVVVKGGMLVSRTFFNFLIRSIQSSKGTKIAPSSIY